MPRKGGMLDPIDDGGRMILKEFVKEAVLRIGILSGIVGLPFEAFELDLSDEIGKGVAGKVTNGVRRQSLIVKLSELGKVLTEGEELLEGSMDIREALETHVVAQLPRMGHGELSTHGRSDCE